MSQSKVVKALSRETLEMPIPSESRIVHYGLGAFHRAHQAWYTHNAVDSQDWGISAFTGRSPDAAEALSAQDGLCTLVTRGATADSFAHISSIRESHDGGDAAALAQAIADPRTAIVTMTITEPAYCLNAEAKLDLNNPLVSADLAQLRQQGSGLVTAGARLAAALDVRRRTGSGKIAIVSCDNLSHNGRAAEEAIAGTARNFDPELALWIGQNVSFVETSVDRITPKPTPEDLSEVAEQTGYFDACAVVTEPFSNWILSGEFPAGRPDWESAGAEFVSEIEQFENRKLWLLNGAHSLLAYAGTLRGTATVAQALSDKLCATWVEEFWDEAAQHLKAPELRIPEYRSTLLERFGNARIVHKLSQIAMEGSSKLRMRALPVLRAELAAGRTGAAAARMIAVWILFLRSQVESKAGISDAQAQALESALAQENDVAELLRVLDPKVEQPIIAAVQTILAATGQQLSP